MRPKTGGANAAAAKLTTSIATLDEVAGVGFVHIVFDPECDAYSSLDEESLEFNYESENARPNCTDLTEVSGTSGDSMPSLRTISDFTNSTQSQLERGHAA